MNTITTYLTATFMGALPLGIFTVYGAQVEIQFEDGLVRQGQAIGTNYSGYGITFSNAAWFTPALIGTVYPDHWVSGQAGLGAERGCSGSYPWSTPGLTNPIVILFAFSVTNVSIDAFDVGANGVRLRGFDDAGRQIGSDQTVVGVGIGSGNGPHTLRLAGGGIRRVVLDQHLFTTANDGVSFDNLRFVTVGPLLSIARPDIFAEIQLEGIVGQGYRIEWSDSLPSSDWHPLTNFVLSRSLWLGIDASSTNSNNRFYRGVEVP